MRNRSCPHCGKNLTLLVPEDIPLIWALGVQLTDAEVAEKFGVRPTTIRNVLSGYTWIPESMEVEPQLRELVTQARLKRARRGRPKTS